ncbi:hypothetical protein IWW37_004008 [Coemansia sp. RSA 2050]|nr:hypothetical protein IWW37_004008 [Coemansia sp. RSA 2050]KAJ2732451.1 hypothetical protein IW152_003782 [Coemansia sp. BCRC 34962]
MRHSLSGYSLVLALVATVLNVVTAHTNLYFVGTKDGMNPKGKYIRPYMRNGPIRDLNDPLLLCRSQGMAPELTEIMPVVAGTEVIVEWHHFNATKSDNVISPSHRGPCLVYMAPLESNGLGNSWFKIYEQGFNVERNMWCTDIVRENYGKLAVKIPTKINNGEYILRTEMIALHNARRPGEAQFYPNCVQISVTGATSGNPEMYSIDRLYSATDPGVLFDKKKGGASYVIPGPPVYSP